MKLKTLILTLVLSATMMAAQAQLLYKISGQGLTSPSYIVGTYHLAPVSFVDSIPGIRQAITDCQQVYCELMMNELFSPDSLALMQQAMMLPDGMTLDKLLTADEMSRLNNFMKGLLGTDLTNPMLAQQMNKLTPSALSTTLSMLSYMKKSGGFDIQNQFDNYFQKEAVRQGKGVGGLETMAFQINTLFKGSTLERQKELLMCLVDNAAFMDKMTEGIVKAFFAQDIDAIAKAMDAKLNNSCDNSIEEEATLIYDRNDDWVRKMPAIMAAKPTLFAVGAAHLPGERGVLHLLRQAGYTVEGVTGQNTNALIGSWSGKLNVGPASLTLVLHLEQADGYVKVTLDSPDQGAKGIPAFKEYLGDDSLAIKVEQIGMTYRARLKGGKLDGTFSQNGFSTSLVLTKGVKEVKRPQTPQPPFPYETEEVTFRNEKDGATLSGTLTWPVGYSPHGRKPAVVLLVSGSGQQNRDEELFDHKPFLVIADYLARQGIATLRYDDRATGASVGGELKNATTADFARDAAAGLEFLRSKKAFAKVGILGHSEGGSIAFMLGAKKGTDFIVTLASPGVKGDTLLAAQSNRILLFSGMSANMTVAKYRQQPSVQQMPWMQWFIDYDPSADIAATRCPVFALNGDRDCQVISSLNLTAIKQLLPKSKRNLTKEYPTLNHLFQHSTTGLVAEYGQIEETISSEVLSDIAAWINGL